MKKVKFILGLFVFVATIMLSSCEKENTLPQTQKQSILPERFKIDIPNSLSNTTQKGDILKSTEADTLMGNDIYQHLNNFIAIGEGAADIVQSIIFHIRLYNIQNVVELTYTADDDNRIKHMVVESDVKFEETTWQYMLTISDLETESNPDGGIGMQVFWNNNPIEGIAIIKPANINFNDRFNAAEALYRVDYSEKGMNDYDAYMMVQISDLPLSHATADPFSVDAIKMFVGKKGDFIDVYGNSNHPNAKFFTEKTGFNWAFIASGNQNEDIAVAEVALPPSNLNENSREIILKDYSVKNVLTSEINEWFIDTYGFRPDSSDLAGYLVNTDAPGFFNNGGFVQGGTLPNNNYSELLNRIKLLTPFNPLSISQLEILFKE